MVRNLDRYSGAATQARNLAEYLQAKGEDISIINISDACASPCEELIDSVRVLTIPRGARGYLRFITSIHSANLIHFHAMALSYIFLSKLLGKYILLKSTLLGEDDFSSIRKRRFGWLRIVIIKLTVDCNNALTESIFRENEKYFPANKIVIIPNFIDVQPITPKVPNQFVFVGAIIKRKRPDLSIKYFIDNYIETSGARLLLIGPKNVTENDDDEAFVEKLLEFESKFPEKIVFLGKLSQERVLEVISSSIGLLFFSEREGMPNSIIESLACNCVPITGSIGGVASEVIEDGVDGFILESTETEVVAINDLESIIESCAPMRKAKNKYSYANAMQYVDLYKGLMAKK